MMKYSMEKTHVYAQGLYFNPVKPETPDAVKKWKKGSISIQRDRFVAQLNELEVDEKGYVRFDLTKNEKDGKPFYSFKLNDWKPPTEQPVSKEPYNPDGIDPESIPF